MKLARCENGHFYDEERFASCPHCNKPFVSEDPLAEDSDLAGIMMIDPGYYNAKEEYPYLLRFSTGESIEINRPIFRIGKDKKAVDYSVGDNMFVSRFHCSILKKNGRYFLIDENSTNHTFLNGEMLSVNSEVPLSDGDRIKIANEEFIFNFSCK